MKVAVFDKRSVKKGARDKALREFQLADLLAKAKKEAEASAVVAFVEGTQICIIKGGGSPGQVLGLVKKAREEKGI